MSPIPRPSFPDSELRAVPVDLLRRLRADPLRAPEHLALAAAELHGPAAAAWVAERRGRYAVEPRELARMAKRRHASLARIGGATTGVGGFVTVVPDLALLAWIQSRMVFFIAAAHGFDPTDPMRPAELLVLGGLYESRELAREALDGAGRHLGLAYVGSKLESDDQLLGLRLARMVGKHAAGRVAGRMIPFVAIAFNAAGNERDTRVLADRAIAFYGG